MNSHNSFIIIIEGAEYTMEKMFASTLCELFLFLDPQFDPDCLIYPKEMQAKLLVYSAKDIKDRIAYFDAHDDERKEMLFVELRKKSRKEHLEWQ